MSPLSFHEKFVFLKKIKFLKKFGIFRGNPLIVSFLQKFLLKNNIAIVFSIVENPRVQKISRFGELLWKSGFVALVPQGVKSEKILSSIYTFGVNHFLSSSPTTFILGLGLKSNVSEIVRVHT